jgi:hypothetical protein
MVTITVPMEDTLIHTDLHPVCSDATCPCQGEQAPSVDLTGYVFEPRTIRHRGAGQDIQISEKPTPRGLRLQIKGLLLSPVQLRELKFALRLWKYGIRQAPEPSPFAQAFGLREFEMM